MRAAITGACALLLGLTVACASPPVTGAVSQRRFDLERDTLAFENELYWVYERVPGSTELTHRPREGVENGQRCAAMAKVVRQFFWNARFVADLPRVTPEEYEELVHRVLERDSRHREDARGPIVIPAYTDLRAFSADLAPLFKEELGGVWRSYVQRGNWRMIFPFAPRQQRATAEEMREGLVRGDLPIVHLVTFPRQAVNHTVVAYDAHETATTIRFSAYDPNDNEHPLEIVFDRAEATFSIGPREYFAGGQVHLYEIYRGPFF